MIRRDLAVIALLAALFGVLVLAPGLFEPLLAQLNAPGQPALYDRDTLLNLALWHFATAAAAASIALAVGLALGIAVTRPGNEEFLPLARALSNAAQAFPPVAILAIAVPLVGFGFEPTFIALLAYGLLPVFEYSVGGIRTIPAQVLEAARGTGMSPGQVLAEIELPLAAPVILAGVRVTAAFSIGTATLGSTVGAKGLGEVIVAGLQTSNLAFIVGGGLIVALLAILVDHCLATIGRILPASRAVAAA